MSTNTLQLPVSAVLPELCHALTCTNEVVLEAPPGAGKTTAVPLALLNEPWLGSQKILLLEPRRIAAKSAALRLAENLGEKVGLRVGYRMRQESNVSAQTKIEVITEGILTRMLQEDPSLEGIGLIIFDEFHERSLNNDLNLALCLEGRELFRDEQPLKLLLMSATLDGAASAQLLSNAPIIKSEGRSYPVKIRYSAFVARSKSYFDNIQRVAKMVLQALDENSGSILVFLPGQREIRDVEAQLNQAINLAAQEIEITPLYGSLPFAQQQRAIKAVDKDKRKIVLATNIAETSITIDGINTVIDSGLCRRAQYDANTGLTRLSTQKISQASSDQRAGRAGRTAPGVCYRLWSQEQQQSLAPFEIPEILSADLSHLVLNLYLWGNTDVNELKWLSPPRAAQITRATQLLIKLGALEQQPQSISLTAHGEQMCRLPMPPRLAHLCIIAKTQGIGDLGCDLAALLAEGDPLKQRNSDLMPRLQAVQDARQYSSPQWQRIRAQSKQFKQQLKNVASSAKSAKALSKEQQLALLIAIAWPERIAQRRAADSFEYKLANGRAARLQSGEYLQKSEYLAIANCGGREGQQSDQIYLACPIDASLFGSHLSALTSSVQTLLWDEKIQRIRATENRCLGEIVLSSKRVTKVDLQQKRTLILQLLAKRGLSVLPWNQKLLQLRERVNFLKANSSTQSPWPDLSDQYLQSHLEDWLAPFISDAFVENFSQLSQFNALDLYSIIQNQLPWPLPAQLDEMAPIKYTVPSGSNVAIDYSQNPPILAVKLQEMFGCTTTPVIGKSATHPGIALQLHLLSPARKPLQITQDIANFWHTSYIEVKKEMKGKYPRHPWPDDPMSFAPTKKTKYKLALEKTKK